jgi:hypothetical protein
MPVLALAPPASAVAVSEIATCAITGDGGLLCWGYNGDGELGPSNASLVESAAPVAATMTVGGFSRSRPRRTTSAGSPVTRSTAGAARAWAGWAAACGASRSGSPRCCPAARAISLGWNRDVDVLATIARSSTSRARWSAATRSAGATTATASWVAAPRRWRSAPAEVAGGHKWAQLAVGSSHACGIDTGALYCWGSTVNGQTIGMITGSSSPRTPCMPTLDCDVGTPKPIGFVADPIGVAAGTAHTCALHDDLITCWGSNDSGQLGTSAAAPFKRDVPQPGGRPWASLLQTGREGQCASPGGSEVWCWGR